MFLVLFVPLLMTGCSSKHTAAAAYIEPAPYVSAMPPVIEPAVVAHRPVIVLDAGHGGEDEGCKAGDIVEKHGTLKVTKIVKKHLNNMGYRVVLTRDRDVTVPLKKRSVIANKHSNSLFVSIHYNSAPAKEAKGIEVYYCDQSVAAAGHGAQVHTIAHKRNNNSQRLATSILDRMVGIAGAASRGVKKGKFHVIRETSVPSVLVELGFITNPKEYRLMHDEIYLDKLARGLANGIHEYILQN